MLETSPFQVHNFRSISWMSKSSREGIQLFKYKFNYLNFTKMPSMQWLINRILLYYDHLGLSCNRIQKNAVLSLHSVVYKTHTNMKKQNHSITIRNTETKMCGKPLLNTACLGGKVWCNYLYYATLMDQLEIGMSGRYYIDRH